MAAAGVILGNVFGVGVSFAELSVEEDRQSVDGAVTFVGSRVTAVVGVTPVGLRGVVRTVVRNVPGFTIARTLWIGLRREANRHREVLADRWRVT